MKSINLIWSFLIVCLVLVSMVVHAEDVVVVALNSTSIIEPPQDPKTTTTNNQPIPKSFNEMEFKSKASEELVDRLGESYFEEHFEYKEAKRIGNFVGVKYQFNYGGENIDMLIYYDSKEKNQMSQMSSILEEPQEILFSKDEALSKVNELDLPSKRNTKLVYDSFHKTLAWKILWDYEPTLEDRIQGITKGYTISAENGEILKTHKFELEPIGTPPTQDKSNENKEIKPQPKISVFQKIMNFLVSVLDGLRG